MIRQNGLPIFSPTCLAEQDTFYYSTLYLLLFADKLTFVKKKFTHRPPGKYFFGFETQQKTCRLEKQF